MFTGDRSELLGLEFARDRMGPIVAHCLAWCGGSRTTHIVVTANASHLCMMRHDTVLREACQAADLVVADGMSVVWALKLLGRPVPERVAGIDVMTNLLRECSTHHFRVYFLGARPEIVRSLVDDCRRTYPGLVVAGFHDGYFKAHEHEAIVEDIRASGAHVLFVGMPTPFKDVFCERHRHRLQIPVIIGVGGAFDVLTGVIARAPKLVQSVGLEWAWRLLLEPRKLWKRYLTTNTEFIWLVFRELVRGRS